MPPPKPALLIIDCQKFFAPMLNKQTKTQILTLLNHFMSTNHPVIVTQHGHPPSDLEGPPYRNQLVRKWGVDGSIHRHSRDWELIPEMAQEIKSDPSRVTTVQKNTYDAFIGTELESVLTERGVERVVVCGVMTDCCVDTTARGSFNRGWETWVVEDACASANRKQHESGLAGFEFGFGEVLKVRDVLGRVG